MKRAEFNVVKSGVVPGAPFIQTAAIQRLIGLCAENGGGTIVFPPGIYLTGTLKLCDHLTLELERGAVLAGSDREEDFPLFAPSPVPFYEGRFGIRALLFAFGKKNIVLRGEGTIDGRNERFHGTPEQQKAWPRVIWFGKCENVELSGLALRNADFWMQHYIQCRNVRLSGLTVWNHGCWNNDGIDIDSCSDVLIEDCRIDSSDDAVCLKCGTPEPCRNVTVRNCVTGSYFSHFKLGTETSGGFENIVCSGLKMIPSKQDGVRHGDRRGTGGIALSAVDGAFLRNVTVENVVMEGARMPFFLRFGDRRRGILGEERGGTPPAFYRDVVLRNISARDADPIGCYICGLRNNPIERVRIEDSIFEFSGFFDPAWRNFVPPEAEEIVPCPSTFGDGGFPEYLYVRHASDVKFRNVTVIPAAGDTRSAEGLH